MHSSWKAMIRVALLAALVCVFSTLAWSQGSSANIRVTKQRPQNGLYLIAQADTRAPQKVAPADKQHREAAASSSAAEPGTEAADRQLDRDWMMFKQQLEREAMNRMRFGRDNSLDRILNFLGPFLVLLVFLGALLWILRAVLENRRWSKLVRVQTDIHTKLLDRFGSSQEMLAYMESEAGRSFLESQAFELGPKQSAAFPYGRILWSAQAGLIVGLLGAGLLLLRGHVPGDGSGNGDAALLVFGTLTLTLGLGFLLSAVVSYVLAKRFGLLERSKESLSRSEPGATRG